MADAALRDGLAHLDRAVRYALGLSTAGALAMVLLLGALGVGLALAFPKYQVRALLQFPEGNRPASEAVRQAREAGRQVDVQQVDVPTFKRFTAAYGSPAQLRAFLNAAGLSESAAATRVMVQAEVPGFWERALVTVLPISRRDQRELGDLRAKESPGASLLGVDVTADARTPELASEMVSLLAQYLINGLTRERLRQWCAAGLHDAQIGTRDVRASLLRIQSDIALAKQRIGEMQGVLARYPAASRMEARQVISIDPSQGGERYLSPLAQIVSVESAISQLNERSRRLQRELKQKEALLQFFARAVKRVDETVLADRLLAELRALSVEIRKSDGGAAEWLDEALYRVDAEIESFDSARLQFGVIGGGAGSELRSLRSPASFGVLFAMLACALIGSLGLMRAGLRLLGRVVPQA